MAEFRFREWLPDQPDLGNSGLLVAKNCLPGSGAYIPQPTPTVFSNALDATALAAIAAIDSSGNSITYAADATKIYALAAATFSDVSQVAGAPYAATSWEFLQWNDQVIATSLEEPVQVITISGANFADLITSTRKPSGRRINSISDHVVLGDVTDTTDGDQPQRVWWSKNNDATDFDPDVSTQSGIQDLLTGDGAVKKIVGGEFGLIFQENAVTRMTFVGGNVIFRFDKIIRNRGTLSAGSVVGFNRLTFFIDEDGFYVTDGTDAIPIGKDKVDRFFRNDLDSANLDKISATIEPENALVCWAYQSNDASGNPDRIITYNWVSQNWAFTEVDTEIIFNSRSTTATVDGALLGTDTIDSHLETIDSAQFKGGLPLIASFDTSHRMNLFDGTPETATFITGEFQASETERSFVNGARPLVDGPAATPSIFVGTREKQTEAVTFSTEYAVNDINEANFRESGRYMRFRLDVAGGFNEALGLQFQARGAGKR